jgi:hypothetical protein
MRDPNRLYSFYDELQAIHMEKFPDLRFGQLMYGFVYWCMNTKKNDTFDLEDSEYMELFKEFANEKTR